VSELQINICEKVLKFHKEHQYKNSEKLVETSNEKKVTKLCNQNTITTGISLITDRIK